MARRTNHIRDQESFERLLDSILGACPNRNPWDSERKYQPDYPLLERLLSVPVRQGAGQPSGRLAKATDAWVAQELRWAGFGEHEVWPRRMRPRVLPQPLVAVETAVKGQPQAPAALREAIKGWSQANVLGQYYRKQVDVVVADWDRGAELIVSTKSMLSSYKNNLKNRFEEFVGDAKNLRGRHPLAAIGLLYVVRSTILGERGAFEFLVDMLTRLRDRELYDAAGLVVVQWSDESFASWDGDVDLSDAEEERKRAGAPAVVSALIGQVPEPLSGGRFLSDLIDSVLSRTPVAHHVQSRELRLGRSIGLQEGWEPDAGE